jgi:iron complex outermembrane receptor protein
MNTKLANHVTAALTSLAALAIAAPAQSQDAQIEEIVVTARKRVENLQDVPDSITAFSASQIDERRIDRIADASS